MTRGDIYMLDFGIPIHQIVVVDKFRLEEKISKLPKHLLSKIEEEIDYVTKE